MTIRLAAEALQTLNLYNNIKVRIIEQIELLSVCGCEGFCCRSE